MAVLGSILDDFEDSSILTEKQQAKIKNSNSLKFFASFDNLLDHRGAEVRDEMILEAYIPVWKVCAKDTVTKIALIISLRSDQIRDM